ncbi:WD repeat-containing protein 25 isoform X2 [Neoarius graeffei]|uniref:WD repeat-containing protein 25 isoform X2 n=1 Tax=Neoarius graeffei TaxID=443677 RepID=UPI00298BE0A2|nr:WD repeat-containing protein 25 isoform X2 [Neoarius graeffei]
MLKCPTLQRKQTCLQPARKTGFSLQLVSPFMTTGHHTMNSLVDYDCDSEDNLEPEETLPENTVRSAKSEETFQNCPLHIKRPDSDLHHHKSNSEGYKTLSDSKWPESVSPVVQTSVCSKRTQATPAGLRPYVSKRQRMNTQPESTALEHTQNSPDLQLTNLRLLSDVSERVQPFLSRKVVRGELPKRVLHQLHAHHGPVITVQWCPVPHLSHLLLSASMDKTFKVWDGAGSGRCLQTYSTHCGAVRDACWLPCGRRLLSGSFDNMTAVTDLETSQVVARMDNQFKVTCLAFQPSEPTLFLCGGFGSEVKAWDSRTCKMVRVYKAGIQQTLDILFLGEGKEFVTSSDVVSRDSADRTLIAWDFVTAAKISNQIFHERYTCPSLAMHPQEDSFVAQTNGNYIALFSSQKPYRMNKRKRYEGHKVEGYAVQCEWSPDGTILTTGSSTGCAHFYEFQSTRSLLTLHAHQQACMCVSYHPVIPATVATCDWGGEIKIWS